MNWKPYAKSLVGAAVAGLTALGGALADDRVTWGEGVGVAVATLLGLGLVYAVPNKAADPASSRSALNR